MGNRALCCGRVCPKTTATASLLDNDLLEDHSCDPAGTVFPETLEDLNEVDRLLLQFASTSNLPAVRWLLLLGGNLKACDTNGTTCLHAACRSGSLAIVRDLIDRGLTLSFPDISGWVALHVAVHTGRRGVAVYLLQRGADIYSRNARGLTPEELCNDAWLRHAISSCASHRRSNGLSTPWEFDRQGELTEDTQVTARLRFEPFFVPRAPVIKEVSRCWQLQRLGVEIFNQRPGQGLAFLVATGAVRDFPIELSSFLMENHVNPIQVGEFLGEDFSLSQTLRLEFINSVRLTGTGVVSCLSKVFQQFHMPSDMQKIDRLVDGIAQIWWRQHEQLESFAHTSDHYEEVENKGEVEGLQLMMQMSNYCSLYQLMFSTIMLHWNLYAPLPPSQRVTQAQWLEMNEGIVSVREKGSGDLKALLRHSYCLIYNIISRAFIPQLRMWSMDEDATVSQPKEDPTVHSTNHTKPASSGAGVPPVYPSGSKKESMKDELMIPEGSSLESWGRLLGGFPSPAGTSGTITYRHIRSILCESTSNAAPGLQSPANSRQQNEAPRPPLRFSGPESCSSVRLNLFSGQASNKERATPSTDRVWMSLRHGLLFLSSKPHPWAPYSFVSLSQRVEVYAERQTTVLSLAPYFSKASAPGDVNGISGSPVPDASGAGGPPAPRSASPQLNIVFLLPDGRWQLLEVARMQIQLADVAQLDQWCTALGAHCSLVAPPGNVPHRLQPSTTIVV